MKNKFDHALNLLADEGSWNLGKEWDVPFDVLGNWITMQLNPRLKKLDLRMSK